LTTAIFPNHGDHATIFHWNPGYSLVWVNLQENELLRQKGLEI
jgi:hypothetical protein